MEEMEKKIKKYIYHITPNRLVDRSENTFLVMTKIFSKNKQKHITLS
jgi:hypothetical protein